MSVEFRLPSLGADMEYPTLVEWQVAPGDVIKRGDVIAVVETDKGAIDLEIFESGKIEKLLVSPGVRMRVGDALALLEGEPGRLKLSPAARARAITASALRVAVRADFGSKSSTGSMIAARPVALSVTR